MRVFLLLLAMFSAGLHASSVSIGPDAATLLSMKKEAKHQFPQAGAVVLQKRVVSEVDAQGFAQTTMYVAILINDDQAEHDYSQLRSHFNAYYYTKALQFAQVIREDGHIQPMSQDAIQRSNVGANSQSLDDSQTIKFALPSVAKGNIIELQTHAKQIKPLIDGKWFDEFYFQYSQFIETRNWLRTDPTLHSDLQVKVAANLPASYQLQNVSVKPQISQQGGHTQYQWQLTNLPAVEVEKSMRSLSLHLRTVAFTSLREWQEIDRWAWPFISNKFDQSSQMQQVLAEIKALPEQQAQIKAVFDYVQDNVRYIGAHVNRGGYEPHLASEVLNNAYGDCKDQSALLVAMYKQLGIEAYPALVSPLPSPSPQKSMPALSFNHMITYLPQQQIWLDTSGTTGTFPGVFGTLEGQTAFVINGRGGQLIDLPVSQAKDNQALVTLSFTEVDKQLKQHIHLSFSGHMDTQLRNMYRSVPNKRDFVQRLIASFNDNVQDMQFSATDVEDLEQPFSITASIDTGYQIPDPLHQFSFIDNINSLFGAFTDFAYLIKPDERRFEFQVLFPMQLVLARDYPNIVPNGALTLKQTATQMDSPYLQVANSGQMNNDKIATATTFSLKQATVPKADYAEFYDNLQLISKHGKSSFVFALPQNSPSVDNLAELNAQQLLSRLRNLLELGEFSQALTISQQLVSLTPDSGEALHLHALALGFNDQYEASEAAFNKAMALGFEEKSQ